MKAIPHIAFIVILFLVLTAKPSHEQIARRNEPTDYERRTWDCSCQEISKRVRDRLAKDGTYLLPCSEMVKIYAERLNVRPEDCRISDYNNEDQ